MKKTLAIILALVMLIAFAAACNGDPDETGDPTGTDNQSTVPGGDTTSPSTTGPGYETDDEEPPPGEIGMYDPDYNYNANPRYKIVYLVSNNTSGLYTETGKSFAHWSSLMNLDFSAGLIDFAGDVDGMMSQLPQLARDYDGIIMDADATMYARVNEIMSETDTPWISFMAAPRDYAYETAPLVAPNAGFEQYDVGFMFGEYLYNTAPEFFPGIPMSQFGFITVDFSTVPPLHEREEGAIDAIKGIDPDMANNRYFVADTSADGMTADAAQAAVSTVLAMAPDIEYWLVFGIIDDFSQGAAAALELAGLANTSFVTTFGGSALVNQWDAGVQTAWKSAWYLPQSIFTEPCIGALYAFMSGQCTPTELWPEWQDKREDTRYGTFATRKLPYYEIRFETYKRMLAWSDIYAQSEIFPNYSREGIDRNSYSARVKVPDGYK